MIRSGFYNSKNQDRLYSADEMNMPYKKIVSNGVIPVPSSAFQVMASSGMAVQIMAGNGLFGDRWAENDAPIIVELDAAHATLDRIDLIVVRSNSSESVRDTDIFIKKGTPASSPVAPEIERSTYIQEYALAEIRVGKGSTAITQTNITDTRPDTARCGWCTHLIQQVDTSTLFEQWKAAGEEAAARNQQEFDEWFLTVKETLATTTLIRQYTNRYDVLEDGVTVAPIGISQYNTALDILEVYVNGWNMIQGTDYTATAENVTFTEPLDKGTMVVFKVFKSIDGSEAESVVQQVYELQNKMNAIEDNIYYCNGYNDNTALKTFIDNWLLNAPTKDKIEIVGTFVPDAETVTASDGKEYSFVYESADTRGLVLDFTKCEIILAPGNFMYLKNVEAVNCTINYNNIAADEIIGFAGEQAAYNGCIVLGSTTADLATAFSANKTRLENCRAELKNSGNVYGFDVIESILEACMALVTSASGSAYGVSLATESRANNCEFEGITEANATTTSGSGGIGGGYFSNCRLIGSGALKGHGFYVRAANLLNAVNCIFRGYTKDSAAGLGVGITGANDAANTVFLTGINCNQVDKTGYIQTGSMQLPGGYGTVAGMFYTAIAENANLTKLAVINRNRV